jgi:hypothetical protein
MAEGQADECVLVKGSSLRPVTIQANPDEAEFAQAAAHVLASSSSVARKRPKKTIAPKMRQNRTRPPRQTFCF